MKSYIVLWKCTQGIARKVEVMWARHPSFEEVVSYLKDTYDAYDTVQSVYHQWFDDKGNAQHSQIH